MALRKKHKILWVEDSARFDLVNVWGPINASHRYDLTLAEDATTAAEYLRRREFDAIIVDVRIPPGHHKYWQQIFQDHDADRTNAKLGLELLRWLLDAEQIIADAQIKIPKRPKWDVLPERIGVFSAERKSEIGDTLDKLGVETMYHKEPGLPDTILLDIVKHVIAQTKAQSDGSPA